MAEFGIGVTDLGRAGFSGYIKQGVVDKSKAMGIESKYDFATSALGYGMEKVKEYDKYQTLKGTAEEIGVLMQEQEDRSYEGQALLSEETNQLKDEMGFIQDKAGYDQTYPTVLNQQLSDDISGVQNALAEKTDRLTKAREQGAMTEFELETRLSKITREAIARNPALAPEIISHVSTVANLNNLTAKVKQDAAITKSRQEAQDEINKALIKMAESNDINLNLANPRYYDPATGGFDYETIRQDVERRQRLVEGNTILKNINDGNEQRIKLSENKVIATGTHYQFNEMRNHKFITEAKAIQNGEGGRAAKIEAIKAAKERNIIELKKAYTLAGIDPESTKIKASIDNLSSFMEAQVAQYEETISNAKELKISQDNISLIDSRMQEDIYKIPGFVKQKNILGIMNDIGGEYVGIEDRTALLQSLIELTSLTMGDFRDPDKATQVGEKFQIIAPIGKSLHQLKLEQFRKQSLADGTDRTSEALSEAINQSIAFIGNPAEVNKSEASRDLVKFFADYKTTPEMVSKMDSEVRGNSLAITRVHGQDLVNKKLGAMIQNTPGVSLKIANDGTIMAVGQDTQRINKELRGLDDTFKAYHKLSGNKSLDQSINEFYAPLGLPLQGATEKK